MKSCIISLTSIINALNVASCRKKTSDECFIEHQKNMDECCMGSTKFKQINGMGPVNQMSYSQYDCFNAVGRIYHECIENSK